MSEILIIDAEQPLVTELTGALTAKSFKVKTFEHGQEALKYAGVEQPSLIVLCAELPKGSGYSICNKLKKNSDLKGIPLIIISKEATQDTFEQHKKLKTRAEDYLIKPFSPDELLEKIGQHIEMPVVETDNFDVIGGLGLDDEKEEELDLDALDGLDSMSDFGDMDDLGLLDEVADEAEVLADVADDDLSVDEDVDDILASMDELDAMTANIVEDPQKASSSIPEESEEILEGLDALGLDDALDLGDDLDISSGMKAQQLASVSVSSVQASEDRALLVAVRRENTDLMSTISRLEAELKRAQEQNAQKVDKIKSLELASTSGASSSREMLEMKKSLRAKDKEIGDLNDQLLEFEEKSVGLEEQLSALEKKSQDLAEQVSIKNVEIVTLTTQVTSLTAARTDLEKESEALHQKMQQAEEALNIEKAELENKTKDIEEAAQKKISILETENKDFATQLAEAYSRLKKETKLREKAREAAHIALSLLSDDVDDMDENKEQAS